MPEVIKPVSVEAQGPNGDSFNFGTPQEQANVLGKDIATEDDVVSPSTEEGGVEQAPAPSPEQSGDTDQQPRVLPPLSFGGGVVGPLLKTLREQGSHLPQATDAMDKFGDRHRP